MAPTLLPSVPMRAASGTTHSFVKPGGERPFSDPVHSCEPVIIHGRSHQLGRAPRGPCDVPLDFCRFQVRALGHHTSLEIQPHRD